MSRWDKVVRARHKAVEFHDKSAGRFAGWYDDSYDDYASSFRYGRKHINTHFRNEVRQLPRGARILDIGCGTGHQLAILCREGFDAVGVEPSGQMRQQASRRLPPGTLVAGSVLELPFEDNTFDFVYALEVFRYLTWVDTLRGLKETYRVLQPGGTFFGTFVNLLALDFFALLTGIRRLAEAVGGCQLRHHTDFETPGGLLRKLRMAGFRHAEVRGACLAPLRVVYRLGGTKIGSWAARLADPLDHALTDSLSPCRALAGHLIGIGRKQVP